MFEGLDNALSRCTEWYSNRLSENLAKELAREVPKDPSPEIVLAEEANREGDSQPSTIPLQVQLYESEAITDRRSVFIGRACRITDPSQVRSPINL